MSWEFLFAAETAERAAATLLHSLWQAALLAVAAAVACRLGRLAVTAQYLVYATALALCAAALPLTYWMIKVDGRHVVAAATKAAPGESRQKAADASPVGAVSMEVKATAVRQPLHPRSQRTATGSTVRTASLAVTWQRAIPWLLACYAVGVMGMLARLALGVAGAERLRRAALPITDGPVMWALTAARRRWPLHYAPAVAHSEQVVVPALVGLLKPTILLPVSAAAGLTPQELELVLAHELAHVVRRDLWVTLFQRIVETVLFFNPAIWYLSRRTSTLREFCADEAACGEQATRVATVRVDYATALLHMAELARPSLSGKPEMLALAAAGRSPSEFRRRIARLLGEPVREPLQASRSGLALVALATVALAVGVAWAEPGEKPSNRAELTASGASKPEASESDESAEKQVERLTKLLPPSTEADRAVAAARARSFGFMNVPQISIRETYWNGEIVDASQFNEDGLLSLWQARGKAVNETTRRNTTTTVTLAWQGPQLLIRTDSPAQVDATTPPGLYTQARYWRGSDGWLGEISPKTRHFYQYEAISKLTEHIPNFYFPQWSGNASRLPWNGPSVLLEHAGVDPELTRYTHAGVENIDGVECDIYVGPARNERIWIEKSDGRVKAISQYYLFQSEFPNYYSELVREIAGRTFRDPREYRQWYEQQTPADQDQLSAHWTASHHSLSVPGNLTIFDDYRNVAADAHWPMHCERIVVHQSPAGDAASRKFYRSESVTTGVATDFDMQRLAAAAQPAVGDAVTDRRSEPAVDYTWTGNEAETQTTITETRDEKVAEMKDKAEQDRLINETPINSVGDAIKILTDGPDVEPTKVWVRAIKYLVDHKEETFPAVVAALDAEERDHPISKLAFTLRAMGDPRGVPALIRALPKTLLPSRSDYGLPVDGGGSDHDELLRFITAHDQRDGDDGDMFTYGRAFREVAVTLQKLTGQDFDEMELNWIHRSETPAQLALQQEQFHRVAQRWAQWWEANWESLTDDEAYSTVNLPALAQAAPPAGGQVLPAGPGVSLEDTRSGWIVQSAHESGERCFVDLDTMREGGWPDSLPPIDKIGADSLELLAWARREGFDLMGFTFTPPGEWEPLYCLKPLDMEAWKMTPSELRELKWSAAGKWEYPLSQPVELMVPRRKILPPFDQAVDGDSFLYLTREGTAGVIRMTAQVPKNSPPGRYSDDQFDSTGFYPGAKVTFAVLRKSEEATEASSDAQTTPGAPAPAPAPTPTSNKPESPRSEPKPEDQSSTIHQLKVIVVDEMGQPIEGALVRQNHIHLPPGVPDDEKHFKIKNERYLTDAAGEATVTWEGKSIDLRIWVSHADRVPLHAMWAPAFQADGDKIPAEFGFELQPGTTIGGVVRDETRKPIAGAKVVIVNHAAFTPAGSATQTGQRPVAVPWLTEEDSAIITDAAGRWKATNIPSDEELNQPQHIKGLYVQDGKVIRLPQDAKGMRIDPKFLGPPLRLQISHHNYGTYDARRDETQNGPPSLRELRVGESVVVLKAKKDSKKEPAVQTSTGYDASSFKRTTSR